MCEVSISPLVEAADDTTEDEIGLGCPDTRDAAVAAAAAGATGATAAAGESRCVPYLLACAMCLCDIVSSGHSHPLPPLPYPNRYLSSGLYDL